MSIKTSCNVKMVYLEKVYVYPDGENYSSPANYKSDDYETRMTALCETCDSILHVHYGEPFASCDCGTQEWTC